MAEPRARNPQDRGAARRRRGVRAHRRARGERDDRGALGPRGLERDDPQRAGRARGARLPLAPAHLGRPHPDRRRLPQVRRCAPAGRPDARHAAPRDRGLLRRDDARPRGRPEGDDPAALAGDAVRGSGGASLRLERAGAADRADRARERPHAAGRRAARPRGQGDDRPAGRARRRGASRPGARARRPRPGQDRLRGARRGPEGRRGRPARPNARSSRRRRTCSATCRSAPGPTTC